MAETFKDYQLLPPIPRSTIVPTAQTQAKTIFHLDPQHPIAGAFRELADNFEKNIETFLGRAPAQKEAHSSAQEVVNG